MLSCWLLTWQLHFIKSIKDWSIPDLSSSSHTRVSIRAKPLKSGDIGILCQRCYFSHLTPSVVTTRCSKISLKETFYWILTLTERVGAFRHFGHWSRLPNVPHIHCHCTPTPPWPRLAWALVKINKNLYNLNAWDGLPIFLNFCVIPPWLHRD